MDFRTEISLEELLAEPMVLALMKRDDVSIGEARALYVSVGQRLKESAGNARTHARDKPTVVPWQEGRCFGSLSQ